MLTLTNVNAFIEGVQVLRDVSLSLKSGSTAALIGRNGAGKTTLLRTIMGFVTEGGGQITLDDHLLHEVEAHQRPKLGIGYAPEDRKLFSAFNVEDNILLPAQVNKLPPEVIRSRLEHVYTILPELKEMRLRPAGSVSGGQGKMVALGRALMVGSKLILLDEPFQGLAPALAQRYSQVLRRLRDDDPSITLLITESNPALLRDFAEISFVIERGEISQVSSI